MGALAGSRGRPGAAGRARALLAGGGSLLLLLAALQLAALDALPSGRAHAGGSEVPPPASDQAPAGAAPPGASAVSLEDRQGWSAERKAEEATRRVTDLRAQASRRRHEPCPAVSDWDGWFDDTLTMTASWAAMRELRDRVRRSGAARAAVHDFQQTFGSFQDWESLRDALRYKMIECAEQLKIARRSRAEEIQLVREREEQRRALELGEAGFGPRLGAALPPPRH
jgi:hypothetical protein